MPFLIRSYGPLHCAETTTAAAFPQQQQGACLVANAPATEAGHV